MKRRKTIKKTKQGEHEIISLQALFICLCIGIYACAILSLIDFNTTRPTHIGIWSEGEEKGEMSKNLSNLDREEIKGDKIELVIGTSLGTYILKTKNTKGRMDFHTSKGEEQNKGETFQKHPYDKRLPKNSTGGHY